MGLEVDDGLRDEEDGVGHGGHDHADPDEPLHEVGPVHHIPEAVNRRPFEVTAKYTEIK